MSDEHLYLDLYLDLRLSCESWPGHFDRVILKDGQKLQVELNGGVAMVWLVDACAPKPYDLRLLDRVAMGPESIGGQMSKLYVGLSLFNGDVPSRYELPKVALVNRQALHVEFRGGVAMVWVTDAYDHDNHGRPGIRILAKVEVVTKSINIVPNRLSTDRP